MEVFTPLEGSVRGKRLRFPLKAVKVLEGSLDTRGRGQKAIVEIEGKKYKVIGCSCGLPNCMCDAYIVEIKK